MALQLAEQSTCARRAVGTIFTDKRHRIVGYGFNGVGSGQPHCIDHPCEGAHAPSGTGLDKCRAAHAEQNGTKWCKEPDLIHTVYVSYSPCSSCVKNFHDNARRIVFAYPYADADHVRDFHWLSLGEDREWIHIPPEQLRPYILQLL